MTQPTIDATGHGVPRTIYGSDGSDWYAILVDSDGHVKIDVVDAVPAKIPSGGTQVLKRNQASNSTVIVHTVTTGKTFYLSSLYCRIANASATAWPTTLFWIRDGGDTEVARWSLSAPAGAGEVFAQSFVPPIAVPADYDLAVSSNVASAFMDATIHGWEE